MQGRDKSHKGSWKGDGIGHCEGARDPAAMSGLNRKKDSEKEGSIIEFLGLKKSIHSYALKF